jgi:hypothetical protein
MEADAPGPVLLCLKAWCMYINCNLIVHDAYCWKYNTFALCIMRIVS